MFSSNSSIPFSIPINTGGDGFGNNGFSDIIALAIVAMIFGWGGNGNWFGGGSNGAAQNYVLSSDFATIQRQLSDGFGATESKLDSISNGICSLGYDQLSHMNGINTNILQSTNALTSQIADCCCQSRYDSLANTNATQGIIRDGFCQTNFNNVTNTRDIIDSNAAGTRAILEKLSAMESNAKDEKIASLTAMNSDLRFQASQNAQNLYIQQLVKPQINPCYLTNNPYCSCGNATPYFGGGFGGQFVG